MPCADHPPSPSQIDNNINIQESNNENEYEEVVDAVDDEVANALHELHMENYDDEDEGDCLLSSSFGNIYNPTSKRF